MQKEGPCGLLVFPCSDQCRIARWGLRNWQVQGPFNAKPCDFFVVCVFAEMGRKRVFLFACKRGEESRFFQDCVLAMAVFWFEPLTAGHADWVGQDHVGEWAVELWEFRAQAIVFAAWTNCGGPRAPAHYGKHSHSPAGVCRSSMFVCHEGKGLWVTNLPACLTMPCP